MLDIHDAYSDIIKMRRGEKMKGHIIKLLSVIGMVGLFFMLPGSNVRANETPNVESSVGLVANAWEALKNDDLESVLDFTNKCIVRYGKRALQMQEKLSDYITGTDAEIRANWALNDVATVLFIQGRAYQNAEMYEEAKAVYQKLVDEYTFGQCWDPKGWFWKPAVVAKENLTMIETGTFFDFGDYASVTLVTKAWEALQEENLVLVLGYADKCISLYEDQARVMQSSLTDYPKGSDEEIFSYWALNDVATARFIKGRAYMIEGKKEEAIREFKIVHDDFSFGQCWDPRGWFWKPASEVDNWLKVLGEENPIDEKLSNIR